MNVVIPLARALSSCRRPAVLGRSRWGPAWLVGLGCALVAVGWPSRIVAFAAAGAVVGAAGRIFLERLDIPCRPPWCEVAGALLSGAAGSRTEWWWVPLLLGWLAVPLAAADLTSRRLPDALTLATYPVLVLAVLPGAGWRALAGVAVFGGAHLVVRALAPRAMGGGDVKLAGGLGAVLGALGWADLALAAALAAIGTLLLAVVTRSRTAPHGPGLLAATWLLATLR